MHRDLLLCIGAVGVVALATAAFAHGGGGGGGGGIGGGVGGGLGDHGGVNGPDLQGGLGHSPRGDEPETTPEGPSTFRDDSRGPSHVSTTGGLHANSHSVISGAGAPTGPLADLRAGMTLVDANGRVVGRISRVIRSSGGVVRNVLVTPVGETSAFRNTLPVKPSTISVSGMFATTSLTLSSHKD